MKVFFDTIGCRLNQSEIERMAYQVRLAGHQLAKRPESGDLIVINTCSVTAAAASDSRNKVRNAHRRNPSAKIVLTGCWGDHEPEVAASLPGVVQVVSNIEKETLIPSMLGGPLDAIDWDCLDRCPIPGVRSRTRAFIKVQDGCDNHCTYCLATLARGTNRSQPIESVIGEVRAAAAGGTQEVVLTGCQLSAYGADLSPATDLCHLLDTILRKTDIPRVRLSSMEPWGLPNGLLELMQNKRVCRQLHLPLQSGCESTLRRMGRPFQPDRYAQILRDARDAIPDLAVTTDIMVGFPGETDKEFSASLAFIEAMAFSRAHVFVYSPRPETAAMRMPEKVPVQVARERSQQVRSLTNRSGKAFRLRFLGRVMDVLWETHRENGQGQRNLSGLTDNYIRVFAEGKADNRNTLTPVLLQKEEGDSMYGIILSSAVHSKE
jgi:threonylcarbamoyladenosine tRNA methylthiotransferase MtaB